MAVNKMQDLTGLKGLDTLNTNTKGPIKGRYRMKSSVVRDDENVRSKMRKSMDSYRGKNNSKLMKNADLRRSKSPDSPLKQPP